MNAFLTIGNGDTVILTELLEVLYVLVKFDVMNCFDVSIADKTYDGILCLKFTHKFSNYCFILMSCYLPPSNSVWGRDGVSFYNHLMSLVYNFSNADAPGLVMLLKLLI